MDREVGEDIDRKWISMLESNQMLTMPVSLGNAGCLPEELAALEEEMEGHTL